MSANWDQSMETGDPHMDREHREIIELVDRLDAIGPDDASWMEHAHHVLDKVMDVTVTHFNTEERLMAQVGYPVDARERMLQQHRDFKAYARVRVLEFRVSDRSSLGLLPGFLRMWLVEHEFGLDRELVGWIRANSDDEVAAPG